MPSMYFIAIVLPDVLNEKVWKFKNYMREKYGCAVALKSPAHITLVPPFWMEEEKQNLLKQELEKLSQVTCFELETNHFSAFRPRTIFIALSQSSELDQLKKAVDKHFEGRSDLKFKPEGRLFHPHITIATRDLSKKDFQEAWNEFERKEFLEHWKVKGISLLRHNGKNWDVVHTTSFRDAALTNGAVQ